jgi:hypothetical protein
MEHDYDLFEILPDGAPLWRQVVAGRENTVQKLSELSRRTPHEVRVMHVLTNTLMASMKGPKS